MAHRVGGEVDGFCTKCRMILAHTILAMVGERVARVRCNTCSGEHAFKASEPTASSVRASKPRASKTVSATGARTRAQQASIEEELSKKDASMAKTYAVSEKFVSGDLVNHPSFGLGIVAIARHDKIDVNFAAGVRTLLHGRIGGPAKQPTYARPPPQMQSEAAEAAAEAEAAIHNQS